MLRVRKANADGLVNKEHICKLVPGVWVIFELDLRIVSAVPDDPARAQLHEQAHGRGAPRAAIGPKYHVVLGWIASAFEKVEKEVASIDVNVPRV